MTSVFNYLNKSLLDSIKNEVFFLSKLDAHTHTHTLVMPAACNRTEYVQTKQDN